MLSFFKDAQASINLTIKFFLNQSNNENMKVNCRMINITFTTKWNQIYIFVWPWYQCCDEKMSFCYCITSKITSFAVFLRIMKLSVLFLKWQFLNISFYVGMSSLSYLC